MTTIRKRAPYGAVKEACAQADGMGITATDLARKFGYSVHSIRSCCRDYGFSLLPVRRRQGSVKELVQAAISQGMTIPQLAETSGINPHTLYSVRRRLGLGVCLPRQASRRP
jgi:transposase-like protein